jgi:hypothetical protein
MRRALPALLAAAALVLAALAGPATAPARAGEGPQSKVIGHSVDGRAITAWHLGDPTDADGNPNRTVLLIATMHGDEQAPQQILDALRDGPAIHGINLWVVPVYNPDGSAAHSRHNAHGVDLNRNYPYRWVHLTGGYNSGPHPASEPETRAMMAFLTKIRPDFVLSFHQPLHGVDIDDKRPSFSRRVAHHLHLPTTSLSCGGTCHGTMTEWFNHNFPGIALTVEYGAHPSRKLMRVDAPRQVLSIFAEASRG